MIDSEDTLFPFRNLTLKTLSCEDISEKKNVLKPQNLKIHHSDYKVYVLKNPRILSYNMFESHILRWVLQLQVPLARCFGRCGQFY